MAKKRQHPGWFSAMFYTSAALLSTLAAPGWVSARRESRPDDRQRLDP
jgi:hypothetical protein